MDKKVDLWYWYYTLPYASGEHLTLPPISNIKRITDDIPLMKKLGVKATYVEHDSKASDRTPFFELQSWLLLQLYKNTDQDCDKLINEFTDFYYGKAAQVFRKYLAEVEAGCQETAELKIRSVYDTVSFPYLNEKNLLRWKTMFDEMEQLVKDDPQALFHVRLARISVEATYITVTAKKEKWEITEKRIDELSNFIQQLRKEHKYVFVMDRMKKWKEQLKKKSPKK